MEDIKEYENNINKFYYHGLFTIFINATLGDRETFYYYISKYWVPRLAKSIVNNLGYGISL